MVTAESTPTKGDAYLKFFAVHPALRQQGIAYTFRKKALDTMKEMGIQAVRTRTWSTNTAMISLNKKLGFIENYVVTDDRGPGIHSIYFKKSLL